MCVCARARVQVLQVYGWMRLSRCRGTNTPLLSTTGGSRIGLKMWWYSAAPTACSSENTHADSHAKTTCALECDTVAITASRPNRTQP